MTPEPHPKIAPQQPAEWADDVRSILTATQGDDPVPKGHWNVFATLAHNPGLFLALAPISDYVFTGSRLEFEDRELLILRTGVNCRSPYELAHHLEIATRGGIDRATVERVKEGPGAAGWSDRQRLILMAADELHLQSQLSDATWSGLREHLDEAQLIEVTIFVGFYHAIASFLNSVGVEVEPELERLDLPAPAGSG
jgi:4-carboxymuconolactone decarboxylase